MRIAYVVHDFLPHYHGGVSIYAYNLARAVSRRHTVEVFFRKWDERLPEHHVQRESWGDLDLVSVNTSAHLRPENLAADENQGVTDAFVTFLSDFRPDVVHFQYLGGGIPSRLVDAVRRRGLPCLLTVHDFWSLCPRGQMMASDWSLCSEPRIARCAQCVFGEHESIFALSRPPRTMPTLNLVGGGERSSLSRAVIHTADARYVDRKGFLIGGRARLVLMEHPPSEVTHRIRLPREGRLRFSLGMPEEMWQEHETRGVSFEVLARSRGEERLLFSRFVDPTHRDEDRGWLDIEVDLAPLAGQQVELTFRTSPSPTGNNDYCTAGWGDLRITSPEPMDRWGLVDEVKPWRPPSLRRALHLSLRLLSCCRADPFFLSAATIELLRGGTPHLLQRARLRLRTRRLLRVLRSIDLLLAPSEFLRRKYIDFGVPPARIRCSDNGMDMSGFERRRVQAPARPVFVFLGNIMPSKGIHVLIDAFTGIDPGAAELRIHGYAPFHEDYLRLVTAMARGHEHISFLGRYDTHQTPAILAEADVLVIPSIWWENSPLTIHEGFMAGVPVLTSDIGGMAELVKDGVGGLRFRAGDAADLRAKVERLIGEPGLIERLSATTPSVKSIESNAVEMEGYYRGVLKSRSSHG